MMSIKWAQWGTTPDSPAQPAGGVDRLVLGVVNWGCLSKLEMTIQVNASRKGGKHMTINMSNYVLGDDIPVDEMILGGIITLEQN